ncbi:MAG: hypothetical protein ABI287_13925 [Rhodanobacter sp.]
MGNKEYEYKEGNQRAADLQQTVSRRETVHFGGMAMTVALRHGLTVNDAGTLCQQKSL